MQLNLLAIKYLKEKCYTKETFDYEGKEVTVEKYDITMKGQHEFKLSTGEVVIIGR